MRKVTACEWIGGKRFAQATHNGKPIHSLSVPILSAVNGVMFARSPEETPVTVHYADGTKAQIDNDAIICSTEENDNASKSND